jgi:hypothetical protein
MDTKKKAALTREWNKQVVKDAKDTKPSPTEESDTEVVDADEDPYNSDY